jgi:hypothetical protein
VPYTDYKTITKTVPEYKDIRVRQGYKTVTEEIPVYASKKIQVGYQTVTRSVPDYKEIKYQVGTRTEYQTVPNYEEEKVVVGYKYLTTGSTSSGGSDSTDPDVKTQSNSTSTSNVSGSKPNSSLIPPEDDPDPVLEEVPGLLEDPLGWLQGTLINAGRQNETVKDAIITTSDALETFNESAVAEFLNENTTETDAAILTASVLIPDFPGPFDEGAIALGIGAKAVVKAVGKAAVLAGTAFMANLIAEFARKNTPLPGARAPQDKNLYFPKLLDRTVSGGAPPPPWDNDPNKQPEDIPPKDIKNLSLGGKIAWYTSTLIYLGVQFLTGGKEPGEPGYPVATPTPSPTSTETATPSPSTTQETTVMSTPSSSSTPIYTPTETPSPLPSATPAPTEIPTPTIDVSTQTPTDTLTPTPSPSD